MIDEKRVCRMCKQEKTLFDFYRQHGVGYFSECKRCVRARSLRWQREHPQERKQQIAKSAVKNRARAKAWALANPEQARAQQRNKRAAKPELYRGYWRTWVRLHPEQALLLARKSTSIYRARQLEATVGPVSFALILQRDGMICHICGLPILILSDLHFDHVVPLAKGGKHSNENIKSSHALCNRRKSDRLMEELNKERNGNQVNQSNKPQSL